MTWIHLSRNCSLSDVQAVERESIGSFSPHKGDKNMGWRNYTVPSDGYGKGGRTTII